MSYGPSRGWLRDAQQLPGIVGGLVRVAEAHWRWLGVLLGTPAAPRYEAPVVGQR